VTSPFPTPVRQPVPLVDGADVLRVVRRDFGEQGVDWVMRLLSGYAQVEAPRVHLAVLKLSAGNHARIVDLIHRATMDYRDLLLEAEYARYAGLGSSATADQKRRAIEEDWMDYRRWLGRTCGAC
jgi:hypothetical protein